MARILVLISFVLIPGCVPPYQNYSRDNNPRVSMSHVLNACDDKKDFSVYVFCVKDYYDSDGKNPDHPTVKWFYYRLDELEEDYTSKKLTKAQAMSGVFKAYHETMESNQTQLKLPPPSFLPAPVVPVYNPLPPRPLPPSTKCRSYWVGNQLITDCQ
jgi:hypothetical protein